MRFALPGTPGWTAAPLTPATFEDFATMADNNGGVWGGCYCVGFHPKDCVAPGGHRGAKKILVDDGYAHAALVYDGEECIGWCQYGPTETLPRIKSKREYDKTEGEPPEWRVTCFYVDKGHRRMGVADAALAAAVRLIADAGGGTVEGYPEDMAGRSTAGGFLYCGTLSTFERNGFTRDRLIAKARWVVKATIPARDESGSGARVAQ